ncbi:hypothetical protein WN51_01864 [Melipona quadrifasciata]|uniref:Uncharacterized protein n=1 Tax=Melipona quadrifasciata TaxID=166423 RepID=A0A0N0BF75_9HYME|nr:hypothetical protein WN51_01864 [Melipona quadrifasciata]
MAWGSDGIRQESDFEKRVLLKVWKKINPDIPTKNRFSIFAECLIKEPDTEKTNIKPTTGNNTAHSKATSNLNSINIKPINTKPPPIYIHGNIDHIKLLDALKNKFKNAFQVKFVPNKLKVMFANKLKTNNQRIFKKFSYHDLQPKSPKSTYQEHRKLRNRIHTTQNQD